MRRGIDVSGNNHPTGHPIDWHAVYKAGVAWVAVKITEGVTYINPWAERDVHQATAAGLEVVGYHFARPAHNNPVVEADHFLGAVNNLGGLQTLALDLEDGRQLGWEHLADWTHKFVDKAHPQIMYWNRAYQHGLHGVNAQFGLHQWIADPSSSQRPADAAIWQYRQGHVPGIVGLVDLNWVTL